MLTTISSQAITIAYFTGAVLLLLALLGAARFGYPVEMSWPLSTVVSIALYVLMMAFLMIVCLRIGAGGVSGIAQIPILLALFIAFDIRNHEAVNG